MNLEDLKDQLKEQTQELWTKIQDNEVYIKLKERYDNLAPNIQMAINAVVMLFVIYFIYSIPSSFVTSSESFESSFDENRHLTRNLIRAGRLSKSIKLPPPAPSFQSLKSQIDGIMKTEVVLPEQKKTSEQKQNIASTALVPKSIDQSGLKIGAKMLNLKQVVRISEGMSKINSSQLINLAMQADSKDPHYYNVDFEVASFSVTLPESQSDKDTPFKKRKKNKKGKK